MNIFGNWKEVDVQQHNHKVMSRKVHKPATEVHKPDIQQSREGSPVRPLATGATPATAPQVSKSRKSYNPQVVNAYFSGEGVPAPEYEYRFCPSRRWRFDLCWPKHRLALEVQGGIWSNGRHTRGAALLKEWAKLNAAAAMGYRILFVQPSELCVQDTCLLIKLALNPIV